MKKILYMLGALLAAVSCNLDKFPSDALSSESMKDPSNSTVVTDGTYAMFKAILMYDGMVYSANSYVRHYFQMAEFRGDNITLCGYTTDPLNSAIIYKDVSTEGNTGYFWWIAYKILFSANAMIDAIPEDGDAVSRHILGENYFIRAVVHLHLLQIYSFPYSHGRDNLGVVLRTSTDCSETHRSTVGECYDQVEADLKKAAELMKGGSRRGNNGYASYEAAIGILSRVYLYEERWQDCIDVVDEVLAGADPASKLDPDYENLFWNSKTSKEVLWCVAMIPSDWTDQKGSMGSMFYSYSSETGTTAGPGAGGWGEIYYSQPLIDLFNRYPQDLRYRTMAEPYQHNADRKMVYWPIADASTDYRSMWSDTAPTRSADGAYVCKGPDGGSYTVKTRIVNTYPETYITYGGEDIKVSVSDQCYLPDHLHEEVRQHGRRGQRAQFPDRHPLGRGHPEPCRGLCPPGQHGGRPPGREGHPGTGRTHRRGGDDGGQHGGAGLRRHRGPRARRAPDGTLLRGTPSDGPVPQQEVAGPPVRRLPAVGCHRPR